MEQQGETSSSFVNMNTWGVTPGEQEWQRTDWTSVLSAVPVHQAQSQLEPLLQRDSQRENADQAQTELFASQEQCDDVTSEDLIGKAREVLNDVSKKSDDFIEWTIKTQLKCVENDYQIQSLASKQDIGKKQHLQIQMGNEQLSNEMENILSSSDEIITKVVNTWEVCNHLTEYYDNLATFKSEEIETAKNELTVQNDKLCAQVKCLSEYCKALIDDYQKEVSTLKNQVQEDRRSRIAEVEAANETYIKLQLNLKEEESKLELEEKRHSSLTLEYEDITRGMEEETLKFKEEMEKINGLSHTLFSNNSLLESEINCMKNKKQELTQLLENTMTTRDSYRDQCAVLEKELQVINNRGKELTEELTAEKEKLSTLEIENRELKTKKEGSDKKKMELLEQKLLSENELKTEKAKLEEIKVKDEFAEQELEDLKLKMENIQLESEEIYVTYKSEISKLENSLSEILKELNIKATDNKQQKIKKDELTKQCEASDIEMKQLASEIQAKDEEALDVTKKLETLNNGIQEEQLKTEELNQAIILKEREVELAKNELERKRKDSQDYKKEMSDAVSSLKQQIQDVKMKQDTTVSECNKKRESIMKYLDECRNNSVSKSNEIENEITAQKNENSSVKDKLNVVKAEKDSFEKNTAMQIELLENSIKQLKEEIEKCDLIPSAPAEEPLSSDSESIGSRIVHPSIQTFQVPPTKNISMSQTYQPPRAVKSSHTYQVPPVQPRPIRKKTFDESDSDHSSVDFSDYINRMSSTVTRNAAQSVPPKRRKFFSQNTSQPAMLQNERMQVHFHKSIKPTPKSRPPSPKVSDNSDADDLLSML